MIFLSSQYSLVIARPKIYANDEGDCAKKITSILWIFRVTLVPMIGRASKDKKLKEAKQNVINKLIVWRA